MYGMRFALFRIDSLVKGFEMSDLFFLPWSSTYYNYSPSPWQCGYSWLGTFLHRGLWLIVTALRTLFYIFYTILLCFTQLCWGTARRKCFRKHSSFKHVQSLFTPNPGIRNVSRSFSIGQNSPRDPHINIPATSVHFSCAHIGKNQQDWHNT